MQRFDPELCGGCAIWGGLVSLRGQGLFPKSAKKPLRVAHMRRLIQNHRHVDEKVF